MVSDGRCQITIGDVASVGQVFEYVCATTTTTTSTGDYHYTTFIGSRIRDSTCPSHIA